MIRSFRHAGIGVAMTFVLSMFAVLSLGCGTIDANSFLGLEACDILNCDGLLFRQLADDHDDMDGMGDDDDHDDEGDDHMDGVDDQDGDGDEDHMDDMGDHDDGGGGDDDATEGDDGSGSGVARS